MCPACGWCPDAVVVAGVAACLPATVAAACGRTVLHRKVVAAFGTEAGDSSVQECSFDGASHPRRYFSFVNTLWQYTTEVGDCVHVLCVNPVLLMYSWRAVIGGSPADLAMSVSLVGELTSLLAPASWLLLSASWRATALRRLSDATALGMLPYFKNSSTLQIGLRMGEWLTLECLCLL